MKKIIAICLIAVFIFLTGCSGGRSSETAGFYEDRLMMMEWGGDIAMTAPAPVATPGMAAEVDFARRESMMVEDVSIMPPIGRYTAPAQTGLMFIKTAHVSLTTMHFDNTIRELRSLVLMHGGFFESSNQFTTIPWGRGREGEPVRMFNASIRVPAAQYNFLMQSIEGLGRHISSSESSREVSAEYQDIEGRIRMLRDLETSFLSLIERATELEHMIMLERELSRVRRDIELYSSRLRQIDSLASFSTIHIDITETTDDEPPDDDYGFFARIQRGFRNSIEGTLAVLQWIVLFFVYVSIPAVIIGILFVVGAVIWKKTGRRKY